MISCFVLRLGVLVTVAIWVNCFDSDTDKLAQEQCILLTKKSRSFAIRKPCHARTVQKDNHLSWRANGDQTNQFSARQTPATQLLETERILPDPLLFTGARQPLEIGGVQTESQSYENTESQLGQEFGAEIQSTDSISLVPPDPPSEVELVFQVAPVNTTPQPSGALNQPIWPKPFNFGSEVVDGLWPFFQGRPDSGIILEELDKKINEPLATGSTVDPHPLSPGNVETEHQLAQPPSVVFQKDPNSGLEVEFSNPINASEVGGKSSPGTEDPNNFLPDNPKFGIERQPVDITETAEIASNFDPGPGTNEQSNVDVEDDLVEPISPTNFGASLAEEQTDSSNPGEILPFFPDVSHFQARQQPTVQNPNKGLGGIPCFKYVPNVVLFGHAQVNFQSRSIAECQLACKQARDFRCLSVSYYRRKKRCLLNRQNAQLQPKWLVAAGDDGEYHENICAQPFLPNGRITESTSGSLQVFSKPEQNTKKPSEFSPSEFSDNSDKVPYYASEFSIEQVPAQRQAVEILNPNNIISVVDPPDSNPDGLQTNNNGLEAQNWIQLEDSQTFEPHYSAGLLWQKLNQEHDFTLLTSPNVRQKRTSEVEIDKKSNDPPENGTLEDNLNLEQIEESCEEVCKKFLFSTISESSLSCSGSINLGVFERPIQETKTEFLEAAEENSFYECQEEACGETTYCCCS